MISARFTLYIHSSIFAVILGGLCLVAWILFGQVAQANKELFVAKEELAGIQKEEQRVSELSREYETTKTHLPELESLLLQPGDALSFVELVESLASDAGVSHIVEDAGRAAPQEQASATLKFNLVVTGAFQNVLRFIYLLENVPTYLSVETVQVRRGVSGRSASLSSSNPLAEGDMITAQLFVHAYTW